jgi:hypothetical protein
MAAYHQWITSFVQQYKVYLPCGGSDSFLDKLIQIIFCMALSEDSSLQAYSHHHQPLLNTLNRRDRYVGAQARCAECRWQWRVTAIHAQTIVILSLGTRRTQGKEIALNLTPDESFLVTRYLLAYFESLAWRIPQLTSLLYRCRSFESLVHKLIINR